jgi:hypothetical protein
MNTVRQWLLHRHHLTLQNSCKILMNSDSIMLSGLFWPWGSLDFFVYSPLPTELVALPTPFWTNLPRGQGACFKLLQGCIVWRRGITRGWHIGLFYSLRVSQQLWIKQFSQGKILEENKLGHKTIYWVNFSGPHFLCQNIGNPHLSNVFTEPHFCWQTFHKTTLAVWLAKCGMEKYSAIWTVVLWNALLEVWFVDALWQKRSVSWETYSNS